jgi:hypothetical protein
MNRNFRFYRNSKLVIEETTSGKYCIRVDYLPPSIRTRGPGATHVVTNNYFSYIHTTSPSETKEEAMAKAEGYVDCLNQFYNCDQTYTNKNKDFYKKIIKKT